MDRGMDRGMDRDMDLDMERGMDRDMDRGMERPGNGFTDAYRALRKCEQRYQGIVEYAIAGIYEVDFPTGRLISANGAFARLTGYAPDELLGLTESQLVADQSRSAYEADLRHSLDTGQPTASGHYTLLTKDGRTIDVALNRTFLTDEYGQIFGATVIAHDLTETVRTDEALRRDELLLRTIIQSASDFLFIKDRDSRVVFVNEAFGKVFHVDIASVIGKNDCELFNDPALAAQTIENDRQVMDSGESETFEESANAPDGLHYFQLFKSPWRNERGEIIGIVGSGMDITARKRLELELRQKTEELTESDRNKTRFLSVLSHELRNPLAAMVASLDLLSHVCGEEPRAGRAIGIFKRQTSHLSRLVDDLLDITRITSNKVSLKKESVELIALARLAAAEALPLYQGKGIELIEDYQAEPITLNADPVRLTQAIGNLLHNAWKFTPGGGRVFISIHRDPDRHEVQISVTDNGAGIRHDELQRIFEPFSQTDESINRNQGGLGLGLSIVKAMIELHGGKIDAQSEGLGKGATFTIRLPDGDGG